MAKVLARGIVFELLKLARVPLENGIGARLVVGDRSPLDLERLRTRRGKREGRMEDVDLAEGPSGSTLGGSR